VDTTVTAGSSTPGLRSPFTRSQYNYDYTNAFFLGRVIQLGSVREF